MEMSPTWGSKPAEIFHLNQLKPPMKTEEYCETKKILENYFKNVILQVDTKAQMNRV